MKILVIDEDHQVRQVISKRMTYLEHEVDTTGNAFEGFDLMKKGSYDLVFSDTRIQTISGISLFSLIREFVRRKTPLVLMSSLRDEDLIVNCARLGAVEFLSKPVDLGKLEEICHRYRLRN